MKPPSSSGLGLRPLTAPTPVQIRSGVQRRNGSKSREACQLGYGVIGNTGDSGSSILGSSPGTPANSSRNRGGFFCSRIDLHERLKRSARMHFDSLSRSKQKHCFCAAKTLARLGRANDYLPFWVIGQKVCKKS